MRARDIFTRSIPWRNSAAPVLRAVRLYEKHGFPGFFGIDGRTSTLIGRTLCLRRRNYERVRLICPREGRHDSRDFLTSEETVAAFARAHRAGLTVMENGEHRFHTDEQLRFLDDWLRHCI